MKWLYFRTTNSLNADNGLISHHAGTNSTLRTSALLKYENLQSILPFDADTDAEPNGTSTTNYIGVIMIFKSDTVSLGQDGFGTVKFVAADKVYLATQTNSVSTCKEIIDFIEGSEENFIQFFDTNDQQKASKSNCPQVISCNYIEIGQNHRLS